MSIEDIKDKSGLSMEVAESLYWHCLWLRDAPEDANIVWSHLLRDRNYRLGKHK